MSKGELTRTAILDAATRLATQLGLGGITIGALATELGLSKSGLFAHFQSKEKLQIDLIEYASARFVADVIKPSLARPRGEPRVRALFESWIAWVNDEEKSPGGCLFVAASSELDDQPGPVRDALVRDQKAFVEVLARAARIAIEEQHFRKDLDTEQFAQELYGIIYAYQHFSRLLGEPRAEQRARSAFDALIAAARG